MCCGSKHNLVGQRFSIGLRGAILERQPGTTIPGGASRSSQDQAAQPRLATAHCPFADQPPPSARTDSVARCIDATQAPGASTAMAAGLPAPFPDDLSATPMHYHHHEVSFSTGVSAPAAGAGQLRFVFSAGASVSAKAWRG
jgi:hypothetical protein